VTAAREWPEALHEECKWCGGRVNAFGCAEKCQQSREHRINPVPDDLPPESRLGWIRAVAEEYLRSTEPENVNREFVLIYEIAGGQH
jgi:hypothetical protein